MGHGGCFALRPREAGARCGAAAGRVDQPRGGKCHHVVAEPRSDLWSLWPLPISLLTQPRGGFGSPPMHQRLQCLLNNIASWNLWWVVVCFFFLKKKPF